MHANIFTIKPGRNNCNSVSQSKENVDSFLIFDILVSNSCCNKLPNKLSGLRQQKFIILTVQEVKLEVGFSGLNSRCQQGRIPSRGLGEKRFPHRCQPLKAATILAHGSFLRSQPAWQSSLSHAASLMLTLLPPLRHLTTLTAAFCHPKAPYLKVNCS